MKIKFDGMLLGALFATIFYSASYPCIHKVIMENISDKLIALSQITNCLSIVFFGFIWNRQKILFRYFPIFCFCEIILTFSLTIYVITTNDIRAYYIADTLIFAIVSRNIICGSNKLKTLIYSDDERAKYDNNESSCYAIATIISSLISMIANSGFVFMLWVATIGNAIDNMFYLYTYNKIRKGENEN